MSLRAESFPGANKRIPEKKKTRAHRKKGCEAVKQKI